MTRWGASLLQGGNQPVRRFWGDVPDGSLSFRGLVTWWRARPRCRGARRAARTPPARGSRSTPGSAGRRRTARPARRSPSIGKSRSTDRVRSPIARSRSTSSSAVTSGATYHRPGVSSSHGSSTVQSPHGSSTCSPRKPQTNHRCSMCSTCDSSSIGVQPDGSLVRALVVGWERQHAVHDVLAHPVQVRRPAGAPGRVVLVRLARVAADAVVLGHFASGIRLPCSSQCSATFFDGCTRGGSPGILG